MIIRIVNIIAEMRDSNEMITEKCYKIETDGYNDVESAIKRKNTYRLPEHYIVVPYWC